MAFTKKNAGKPAAGKKKEEFDNKDRGALFENEKDGNENRPDFTGYVAIDPEEYEVGDDGLIHIRLAAWNQESKKGVPYLSIKASQQQASA